jgi:uncharacterized repeat protein (TIGR01451 family)
VSLLTSGPTGSVISQTTSSFTYEIDNPSGGTGNFSLLFQAVALSGGNTTVCNTAYLLSGSEQIEISDDINTSTPDSPTCVEGYDLIVDKTIYPDRDTDTGDSINTYPANIASGIIYSGDRVVYHVNVTNDGPGDAYGVDWSDLLDPGMELFEYANVTTESGLTITIPGGDDA